MTATIDLAALPRDIPQFGRSSWNIGRHRHSIWRAGGRAVGVPPGGVGNEQRCCERNPERRASLSGETLCCGADPDDRIARPEAGAVPLASQSGAGGRDVLKRALQSLPVGYIQKLRETARMWGQAQWPPELLARASAAVNALLVVYQGDRASSSWPQGPGDRQQWREMATRFLDSARQYGIIEATIRLDGEGSSAARDESEVAYETPVENECQKVADGCVTELACVVKKLEMIKETLWFGVCVEWQGGCRCASDFVDVRILLLILLGLIVGGAIVYRFGPDAWRFLMDIARGATPVPVPVP